MADQKDDKPRGVTVKGGEITFDLKRPARSGSGPGTKPGFQMLKCPKCSHQFEGPLRFVESGHHDAGIEAECPNCKFVTTVPDVVIGPEFGEFGISHVFAGKHETTFGSILNFEELVRATLQAARLAVAEVKTEADKQKVESDPRFAILRPLFKHAKVVWGSKNVQEWTKIVLTVIAVWIASGGRISKSDLENAINRALASRPSSSASAVPGAGPKVKPLRNDPCPCGKKRPNGLPMKYKMCCGRGK